CYHDVALEPDGPRWSRARQFAGPDAVGPIGERLEVAAVRRHDTCDIIDHDAAGWPRLQPPRPGCDRGIEMPERLGDRARRVIAELMAVAAPICLNDIEPLVLRLETDRDAIAIWSSAREHALVRDPQHREPIDRRVVLRGGRFARSDHRGQVELLAGLAV